MNLLIIGFHLYISVFSGYNKIDFGNGVIRMARVRRTAEEKIAALEAEKAGIQAKIENLKAKMAEVDASIKEIQDGQKQKDLENLLEAIKATGKTPAEILASLKTA